MSKNKNRVSYKKASENFNITKDKVKKFKLENYLHDRKFKSIDELVQYSTAMVNLKCTKDYVYDGMHQLTKGVNYVCPLNFFTDSNRAKTVNKVFKPANKSFEDMFKRYRGEDLNGKSVLFIRMGGIGDIIVSQSIIKYMKEKWPDCKITYATKPTSMQLFSCFPIGLVDVVTSIPVHSNFMNINNYHVTFIGAIERCEAAKELTFYEIYRDVCNLKYDVKDYISTLVPNNMIIDSIKHVVPKNTILLHMKSTSRLRSYDDRKWIKIIKLLIEKGYYVGIMDMYEAREEVTKFIYNTVHLLECEKAAVVKNVTTPEVRMEDIPKSVYSSKILNLAQISQTIAHGISIYSLCKAGITIDSSFAHISGALRKPAVTICGPYPSRSVVQDYETVQGLDPVGEWNECEKKPCYYNSNEFQCPYVAGGLHPGCTDTLSPEYIVEMLEKQIEKVDNLNI